MARYVVGFDEIDQTMGGLVGGKGANLGELSRVDGVDAPPGFCVTTEAFERITAEAPMIDDQLDRLALVTADDREAIAALSAEIRRTIEAVVVPADVAAAITDALGRLDDHGAYAVRSSATAEDLSGASFAGQQDTFLNVVGPAAILEHVRRCWASLYTERAVTYRVRNGFDHRKVHMAVVVQRMVAPEASGVMFTADPVTGNRTVTSIEASFGLGEALVSGLINPDTYLVRDDLVMVVDPADPDRPALTDAQVVRLARLGRRIEAHFGSPQDIEWCLVDDDFAIVQSRPITTLFPVPPSDDGANHLYVSVGHGQMMTDAMKPLGLSMWKMIAMAVMHEAGGRLFVDVAPLLAGPGRRAGVLGTLGRGDPLIGDALQSILDRGNFITSPPDDDPGGPASADPASAVEIDPAVVEELIADSEASIATLRRHIRTKSGEALFDFVVADIPALKRVLSDPRSHRVFMGAMEATWWLNEKLEEWLGEKNVADTLTLSVAHNVTSEMGLALMDVADVIRPYPEVVAFLETVEGVDGDGFLDEMVALDGGRHARTAIEEFLDRYGMRCVGEIDITRPRWRERPADLAPVIVGNIKNFEPGAGERRFEQGRRQAEAKEQDVLARLRALPEGERKARETKAMIDRVRTCIGYREYPKYGLISRYFVYKQALMKEADALVGDGVIGARDDIFFLTFDEFRDAVGSGQVDADLITRRRDEFRSHEQLTPPRVITSDGEVVAGAYRRDDVPPQALVGLPVSAGTVEGRARVILDMAEADIEPGDILVTAFTDPSWTPLFVAIAGLVTEVGGLMTHGAVIARECGLPAVVGVEHATELIRDGQRIRVHGTDGYVELLS